MSHSQNVRSIRNFGMIAHIDAGKTTTTENLLRFAKVIHRIGSVDDGTTTTDDYILEQRKGITIFSAAVTCHWRGHVLNLIDTPGHVDFTAEVERSLRVLDGAVVIFDAVSGVEAQTETVWRQATRYGVPRICFFNKMDRVGASLERCVETIRKRLAGRPVVLTLPFEIEDGNPAVIDVLRNKVLHFDPATEGETVHESDVPPERKADVEHYRALAAEAAAEFDETLMQKFLENQPLSNDEIKLGLRIGTLAGRIQPAFCGAARIHCGVQPVMDGIVDFLPSPLDRPVVEGRLPEGGPASRDLRQNAPFCALVFKTATDQHRELAFLRIYTGHLRAGESLFNPRTGRRERPNKLYRMFANHRRDPLEEAGSGEIIAVTGLKETVTGDTLCAESAPIVLERMQFPEPVLQVAIEPRFSGDKEKLEAVLHTLAKDDPTFRVTQDRETGQTMLQCMGELHSEVILFRIINDFKVQAILREPRVAYKEMPREPAEAEATYSVKLGDKSVFGHVKVRVQPLPDQVSPRVREELPDDETRKLLGRFLPAIRDGLLSESQRGPIAGLPVIHLDIAIVGGSVSADSKDPAYSVAAAEALRRALSKTNATIVEPHMKFEVTAPAESIGDVINDLNRRGASISEIRDLDGGCKTVSGCVPLAQMFGYATTMRSLTRGLGTYTLEPFEYLPISEAEMQKRFGGQLGLS